MTSSAIIAPGLRKSYGDQLVLDGIDLDVAARHRLRPPRDPTAPARPPPSTSSRTLLRPTPARCASPATTWPRADDGVRASIGVTGQFSAVDDLLTGGRTCGSWPTSAHLPRAEAQAARGRGPARAGFDLVDAADRAASTYSGGMRAAPRPGHDPPRVARRWSSSTSRPPGLDPRSRRDGLGRSSRSWSPAASTVLLTTQYLEEADRARRTASRVLDGGRIVAEGTAAELKAPRPRAATSGSSSPTSEGAGRGARSLGDRARLVDAALTLEVPSDGSVRQAPSAPRPGRASQRRRRAAHRAHARSRRRVLRPHRPHGTPQHRVGRRRPEGRAMSPPSHLLRDSLTMLQRNLLHAAALPLPHRHARRAARSCSCCCSSASSAAPSAPAWAAPAAGAAAYLHLPRPVILFLAVSSVALGTAISGGHGHDRMDHRPLPHHGHLPLRRSSPGTSLGALVQAVLAGRA